MMSRRYQPHMRAAILAAIEAGHQRTEEISAHTGIATREVCTRLCYMRGLGLVNNVRAVAARGGKINIWRLGPAQDLEQEYSAADERRIVISKVYPVIGRRDPLDIALFGAPAIASTVTA